MILLQSILADAVRRLRKVAASSGIEVFTLVRCTCDALGTHLTVSDAERFLSVSIPNHVGTSDLSRKLAALVLARNKCDFLVPIATLCQVVKAADKGSKITIEPVGFSYVTGGIEANTAVATDVTIDLLPDLPNLTWHEEISSDPLRKAILAGLSHASQDETRYVLIGMLYSEKGEAVATDGRRLYLRRGLPPIKFDAIIQTKTCELVENGMSFCFSKVNKEETRYIKFTKVTESLTVRLVSKLVDGTFPNFKQVIPSPDLVKCKVQVDPHELAAMIRKVFPKKTTIRLEVTPGQIRVSGKSGSFKVAAVAKGEFDYICFNADFIAEALDAGLNTFNLNDYHSPCFLTSTTDPFVKIIVMPMKESVDEPSAPTPPPVESEVAY